MTKFWLKGCKRCGGDLYEVFDLGERYVNCLQCGRGVYDTEDIANNGGTAAKGHSKTNRQGGQGSGLIASAPCLDNSARCAFRVPSRFIA